MNEILFSMQNGRAVRLFAPLDPGCDVDVYLENIDLTGSPTVLAEESHGRPMDPLDASDEPYTWTFYRLATVRGGVTLRWYGTPNGYYSERVEFEELPAPSNSIKA